MTAPTTSPVLTVEEFAARIQVSRTVAYEIIGRGEIDVVDIGNGRPRIRVTAAAIDAYLARRTIRARAH